MAAGSVSSSMTSTSNTLTFAPGIAAHMPQQNGAGGVHALLESLAPGRRHAFLAPPPAIPAASLQVVKDTLDAFAGQISDEQLQRLKEANRNRKRKREAAAAAAAGDVLKIRKVHLDGFETGQVWQQTRRIIQSALRHSEEALKELEERHEIVVEGADGAAGLVGSEDDEDLEIDLDGASDELDGGEEDELSSGDEVDDAELDPDSAADLLEDDLEALEDEDDEELLDDEEEDDEDDEDDGEEDGSDGPDDYVEDPNGLNDGFFSIDDFNKQTQWFEDQDARGDPNTDAGDEDEDEIDWAADPLAASSKNTKQAKTKDVDVDGEDKQDGDDDEDDDDEEDGPTFGNMDLYAPEGESEDEDMDDALEEDTEFNANDVFYKDFFAPPARKADKNRPKKSVRFNPKPVADEDVDRAMEDVRRALFDDESDHGDDSDGALSDMSAGDPRSRRSAHERRQAKLAEEIRKLEAASVAKREWALMGEASAVERPQNSLLEQDLDFEHAGKPIPVITEQVTEGIEELIKRRILAQEFDEVIRRRPDAASVAAGTRRGLVELDDTKSSKGLAELYEDEHQKNANPDSYVSKSDEKLRKEEAEVERIWRDLNSTLDALSSWNYRPRPSEPSLTVVADTATISMEDAQPATAQGVIGGDSTLAPQEVYKAGGSKENVEKGEVVAKSGLPVARGEMTREDKQRRRRREKERIRKAGGVDAVRADGKKPVSRRAQMQKETMADLKKGGVKVINRKGEVVDMAGNKAKAEAKLSSNNFKL
ncbi:hypothetical protein VD0002_g1741 [Verticillium dahliae]|uniref:U3 small nucleolar ribonucleoprotein protein MPP10 n=1 Tax=Verticillium dahliae TaxID=27337 RepID=A0A2J8E0T8_VERDA|nr:hypothetical protein BJF96_g7123 [Verticillium dahliae]PNH55138.1 hypothetical protein VD0003_g2456 [Verticillium dahliae]PNH68240.1 hypothetical protein VD0002_g1741 [Verticillium dahliae]RXG47490.1 hypothetical protein VDGE_21730 [Verticillium dahliae]